VHLRLKMDLHSFETFEVIPLASRAEKYSARHVSAHWEKRKNDQAFVTKARGMHRLP
jgi:hypothetical protein